MSHCILSLMKDFKNSYDGCVLCGSQRCDRSPSSIESCEAWHEYLEKEYVVCEEVLKNGVGIFSIRHMTDCSPSRFQKIAAFRTYDEAHEFLDVLK